MDTALWATKTGMDALQTEIDIVAHNLANANTTAFKSAYALFQELYSQTVRQPGDYASQTTQSSTGLQIGTGVRIAATRRLHTQGKLNQTDNSTDVAINGAGFFKILVNEMTAYTRDGSFQLDKNGYIVTASGYKLEPPIQLGANVIQVSVGRDGTVSVLRAGADKMEVAGRVQLTTFINPAGLKSIGDNLYSATDASGEFQDKDPGTDGAGELWQGYLETSNVNIVEEMIKMIQAQRLYEINSKAITAQDQMLARLGQVGA